MYEPAVSKPPRSFWPIAIAALIWNILGVAAYLGDVMMGEDALAALPADEQALYAAVPAWATGAYAFAVFGGLLGSIGLLLRKKWAAPVFVVSLIGVLVQMFQTFFLSDALAVYGAGVVVMPLFIIAVGIFLIVYSRKAAARGWLT